MVKGFADVQPALKPINRPIVPVVTADCLMLSFCVGIACSTQECGVYIVMLAVPIQACLSLAAFPAAS